MQIHVYHDGQQQGPLDLDLVRSRLADGSLSGADLAWREGMAGWEPLATVLAAAGGAVPPATPGMAAGALPAGQMPAYAGQPQQETSGLATASMVLGFCSFVFGFLTGLPAVICGHMSLSQIKKSGGVIKGRGMAITGLVIGYLTLIIFPIAILAGIALPVFNAVQEKGLATKSLSDAKQVALACKLYAGDHDGNYPPTLDDLAPTYLNDKHLLVCPLGKDQPDSGYDYFGGKETDPADKVLLSSQATTRDHKKVVAHMDGSAELVRVPE